MKVIAFFDLFDFPLTVLELRCYGSFKAEVDDYDAAAEALKDQGRLDFKHGFYFLPGRQETVVTRSQRYNYAERKFRRALRAARLFKFIPWIRLVAVGNLIGADNLKDESDIDLFIITEPKRIWLTRFFCAGLAEILRWRPKPGAAKDGICLSFFLSEEKLDLSGLMLNGETDRKGDVEADLLMRLASLNNRARRHGREPAGPEGKTGADIYFIYWLAGLTPLYDAEGAYEMLASANAWLKDHMPNWQPIIPARRRQAGAGFSRFYRDVADMLSGGLEPTVKKWQLKRMPEYLARPLNKDTRVIANDHIIKLHANDRREEYRDKYLEALKRMNLF